MDSLSPIQFFLLNVLSISILVAIVEICIEKEKGWGAGLNKNRWYGKIIGGKNPILKFLATCAGVPYFFGYAIFMYFILVPCILLKSLLSFIERITKRTTRRHLVA